MATDQIWKNVALSDEAWALSEIVERAPHAKLSTDESDALRRVKDWLDRVDPILDQAQTSATELQDVPPLEITREELHALVNKLVVKSAPSAKQRRRLAGQWRPVEQFHRQLGWLRFTSILIAVALVLAAAINVIDLLWLKDLSRSAVIGTNLLAITAVSGLWAVHHLTSVLQHMRQFNARLVAVLGGALH